MLHKGIPETLLLSKDITDSRSGWPLQCFSFFLFLPIKTRMKNEGGRQVLKSEFISVGEHVENTWKLAGSVLEHAEFTLRPPRNRCVV
jgi:hypothetical protein